MKDNISFMKDFKPLSKTELETVQNVRNVFDGMKTVPCTACRYCTDGCPKHIAIPDIFACLNSKKIYRDWNADYYYGQISAKTGGKASDCTECGKCEKSCPQHLPVRKLLKDAAKEFER